MKDSLLFINRNQAEIEEFVNAMQDYTFHIDTAASGLDAAILLRKREYKVVITGMNLSTYDGTKLISYLNGHSPNTACIVYTTRIDLAQLRLLVNKREVFRIFLKPVNYRGDFYNAIQDGFAYYDMRKAEEEQIIREQKLKTRENAVGDMEKAVLSGKIEEKQMKHLVYPFGLWSAKRCRLPLTKEEQEALMIYEKRMLDYHVRAGCEACGSLAEIEERICQEFAAEEQRIEIHRKYEPVSAKPEFFGQLQFILWLTVRQIADISSSYKIRIDMDFQLPFRPILQIRGNVEEEAWEAYRKAKLGQMCVTLVTTIVEAFGGQCRVEMEKEGIFYRIQMRTEAHKTK